MDDEEQIVRHKYVIGQSLEGYSTSELEEIIIVLNSEVKRVNDDILNKIESISEANSIFKF